MNKLDNLKNQLKNVLSYDIINIDEVLNDENMKKIKQSLIQQILEEQHPYDIYYSQSEQSWRTYLKDDSKPNNRRPIKRKSKENLENYLAEYYLNLTKENDRTNITLEVAYKEWMIYRRDMTSTKTKTISENKNDWDKFFRDSELATMPLKEIKPIILIRFFRNLTKEKIYTYKRISNARSVLNGIFSWAIEEEIIAHNPISDVNFKTFSYKPVEVQTDNVFTQKDVITLLTYLQPITDEPYALAIQLFFYLFIRIGELKALCWEDINLEEHSIYLHKQALVNRELKNDLSFSNREVVISNQMKGGTSKGYRKEHLTDESIRILECARALNPNGKFIFEPNGKIMTTDRFNRRLERYCNECGVKYHSSHKIRFYCASTAYDGKNLGTISRLMGHSQTATTLHYLRNVDKGNDSIQVFEHLGLDTQK